MATREVEEVDSSPARLALNAAAAADVQDFCRSISLRSLSPKAVTEYMLKLWTAGAAWATKYPQLATQVVPWKEYPR
jgi:hypothetical protein